MRWSRGARGELCRGDDPRADRYPQRREQLAGDTAEPQHRFATTSDNIAEFAVAGSFIFGQPLKSIEHVDIDELG